MVREEVEEYMAELDIDREDICVRKNWRRNVVVEYVI